MKRIKRTITIQKVEITKTHLHETDTGICPLCHSPLISTDSANEIPVSKFGNYLMEKNKSEKKENGDE